MPPMRLKRGKKGMENRNNPNDLPRECNTCEYYDVLEGYCIKNKWYARFEEVCDDYKLGEDLINELS